MYRTLSIAFAVAITSSTMLSAQSTNDYQQSHYPPNQQQNTTNSNATVHWPFFYNPFWLQSQENAGLQNLNSFAETSNGRVKNSAGGPKSVWKEIPASQFGATQNRVQYEEFQKGAANEPFVRSQGQQFNPRFVPPTRKLLPTQQFGNQSDSQLAIELMPAVNPAPVKNTLQDFEYTAPKNVGTQEAPVNPVEIQFGQANQQEFVENKLHRQQVIPQPAREQIVTDPASGESVRNLSVAKSNEALIEPGPSTSFERKLQDSAADLHNNSPATDRGFTLPSSVHFEPAVVQEQKESISLGDRFNVQEQPHSAVVTEVTEAHNTTKTVETTDSTKQKAALVTPIRRPAKSRVTQRTTKRASRASSLWGFLPLLLLPLIGWLGWKWFGRPEREQTQALARTEAKVLRQQTGKSRGERTTAPDLATMSTTQSDPKRLSRKMGQEPTLEQDTRGLESDVNSIQAKRSLDKDLTIATQDTKIRSAATTAQSQERKCEWPTSESTLPASPMAGFSNASTFEQQQGQPRDCESKSNSQQAVRPGDNPRLFVGDEARAQTQRQAGAADLGSQAKAIDSEQEILRREQNCQLESCDHDDLTKIRGLDADHARQLQKSGIDSFSKLYSTSPETISQIVSAGNSKLQSFDPIQWTQQALYAMKGDWNGLSQWQDANLDAQIGSRTPGSIPKIVSGENAEFVNVQSSPLMVDDLTKIKGIGAAAQKVLAAQGIQRFEQIAQMDCGQLEAVFADCRDRFQLLNFETWAAQARAILGEINTAQDTNFEERILDNINSISVEMPASSVKIKQD